MPKPTLTATYRPGAVSAADACYIEASMRDAIDGCYQAGRDAAPMPETITLMVGPSLDAALVPGIQQQMQHGALVAYAAGLQDRAAGRADG